MLIAQTNIGPQGHVYFRDSVRLALKATFGDLIEVHIIDNKVVILKAEVQDSL